MLIYMIKNKINGKVYIGQTKNELSKRIGQHISATNCGSGMLIHKAIRKYGLDNFDITIIKKCESYDELDEYELFFIEHYNSMVPNGYNLKTGGNSNSEFTEQHRLNISKAMKGRKHSEETKKRISESNKGKHGYLMGKKLTEAHRKNIGLGHIGKKRSKDTRIKLSQQKLGDKNPMYGKTGADHPNSKEIFLVTPNGCIEKFVSLSSACEKYDLDIRNLSAVYTGKRKSHKGFKIVKKD